MSDHAFAILSATLGSWEAAGREDAGDLRQHLSLAHELAQEAAEQAPLQTIEALAGFAISAFTNVADHGVDPRDLLQQTALAVARDDGEGGEATP